jgi:hypothetical protein
LEAKAVERNDELQWSGDQEEECDEETEALRSTAV